MGVNLRLPSKLLNILAVFTVDLLQRNLHSFNLHLTLLKLLRESVYLLLVLLVLLFELFAFLLLAHCYFYLL